MHELRDLQGRCSESCRVYAHSIIESAGWHRGQTTRSRRELHERALAIIERDAHLSGLSLACVADQLAVSSRQLQRVLREVGQTTFRACLDSVRMERAIGLLRENRNGAVPMRSVREVAAMVGYNQPAGFAKAFRRYHGIAPHEVSERRT